MKSLFPQDNQKLLCATRCPSPTTTIGVARFTQRYEASSGNDDSLRLALIRLAKQYGRYGYRKIAELLRIEGWKINHKKVERL